MNRPSILKKGEEWMLSQAMRIHAIERPGQILKMQDGTIYRVDPKTGAIRNTTKNRSRAKRNPTIKTK